MSVFRIIGIDGDQATVLAESRVPGAYEFRTPLRDLVRIEAEANE